ncbi:MAG: hypothetical protein IT529_12495 [Burkholderiales bacterium]|nr:hypothetical protein [Burkholderiales bacterium]
MRATIRACAVPAALLLCAAAHAAMPRDVIVTRESQDLYRAGSGSFYIKTTGCTEQIYSDRVTLKMNIGVKGGMMFTRAGRACVIDKLLREVNPATMLPAEGGY